MRVILLVSCVRLPQPGRKSQSKPTGLFAADPQSGLANGLKSGALRTDDRTGCNSLTILGLALFPRPGANGVNPLQGGNPVDPG